jgi:hypothetical protein
VPAYDDVVFGLGAGFGVRREAGVEERGQDASAWVAGHCFDRVGLDETGA